MIKKYKCIFCAEQINSEAKICLKCNKKQDWTRFFDVGNTSLSLLIAIISVSALASENILKAFDYFIDKEKANLAVSLLNATPKKLKVFFDNDGPGLAIFSGGSVCSIWPTEKTETLYISEENTLQGTFTDVKYPECSEVVGRYIYSYHSQKNTDIIIPAGASITLEIPFLEMVGKNPTSTLPNTRQVKSYCSLSFTHENGKNDVIFNFLDPLQISLFSLDNPDAQKSISIDQP